LELTRVVTGIVTHFTLASKKNVNLMLEVISNQVGETLLKGKKYVREEGQGEWRTVEPGRAKAGRAKNLKRIFYFRSRSIFDSIRFER
jgi:hypothetical protein